MSAPVAGADAAGAHLPKDWRTRLPSPASYYAAHLPTLHGPVGEGQAHACCPFHDLPTDTLDVILTGKGAFRCTHCGAHGDMVDFHQRTSGRSFKQAVRQLIGLDKDATR